MRKCFKNIGVMLKDILVIARISVYKHRGHIEGYTRSCKDLFMYKNWINTSNKLNIYWVITHRTHILESAVTDTHKEMKRN